MTQYFGPTYGQNPAPKPKGKWYTKPLVWVPAIALVCGLAIGSGSASAQTVEVEKRVEVPVEKIVNRTVEKEVTPESCIKAIDTAQQALFYSADSMGIFNEAMQAASTMDVAGIYAASSKLEALNPKISALTEPMRVSVADCRAKAK